MLRLLKGLDITQILLIALCKLVDAIIMSYLSSKGASIDFRGGVIGDGWNHPGGSGDDGVDVSPGSPGFKFHPPPKKKKLVAKTLEFPAGSLQKVEARPKRPYVPTASRAYVLPRLETAASPTRNSATPEHLLFR